MRDIHIYNATQSPLHRLCSIPRLFIALLLTVVLAVFSSMTVAQAASMPGGNVSDPSVRAVDIALPSVVRIFTTVSSHVLVNFPTGTIAFPTSGNGYQLGLSGSGTFISAHGDILTADHVVKPPTNDASIMQAFADQAAPDVTTYVNQHNIYGRQLTQDQVDQGLRSGQIPFQPKYDTVSSEVFLSTYYTGPLTASDLQTVPSDIHAPVDKIEKEVSFDQGDVAIVHAQFDDTPSVQLGDSSNVAVQDQLKIIGFPGPGDVSNSPTNLLTSSVNDITVSSIKTTDTGAHVIQVGGNVEHGDSGGPALDSTGNVVGIVSFGISSPNSPAGTSFLQASNNGQSLLQQLNLDTTPGTFQKQWVQAFTDYASTTAGHWHKAQAEFQKLATSYPLFKGITPYLNYTGTQAATEHAPQATPTQQGPTPNTPLAGSSIAWTAVAIVVFVALISLLVLVAVRRPKRGKQAPAGQIMLRGNNAVRPFNPLPPQAQNGNQAGTYGVPKAQDANFADAMSAFGAPTTMQTQQPVPPAISPLSPTASQVLRPWPCGHMNRSNAHFCSICGEPAPPPPTIRRVEQ